MKKNICVALVSTCLILIACNNEGANSSSENDSIGKNDNFSTDDNAASGTAANTATITTDDATRDFLKKAADGGLAEVDAGKMAQEKGTHDDVKRFASMMVNDHTGANAEVMRLADERKVDLPTTPSEDKKQKAAKAGEKSGNDFDKAYMAMMVDDHKSTISLFEKAQSESTDEQVKGFITSTLPKLKMHLDSAQAIQARVKK